MIDAVRQANRFERGERLEPALPPGQPGVDERHLHVLERRVAGEQVVSLEHEPDAPIAQGRKAIVVEAGRVLPSHHKPPRAGAVENPDKVHEGGFARSRGAHNGDELTLADRKRRLRQRVYGRVAHAVAPRQSVSLEKHR